MRKGGGPGRRCRSRARFASLMYGPKKLYKCLYDLVVDVEAGRDERRVKERQRRLPARRLLGRVGAALGEGGDDGVVGVDLERLLGRHEVVPARVVERLPPRPPGAA